MVLKQILISSFLFLITMPFVSGQTKETVLDPSGYLLKYDTLFNGIGPKVYVLPAPRTKTEELTDTYQEIIPFQDSINKAIRYQKFINNLKTTSNALHAQYLMQTFRADTLALERLLQQQLQENNIAVAYGLLNEYAKIALLSTDVDRAIEHLRKALELVDKQGNSKDIAVIQTNLSNAYILNRNPTGARQHELAFYDTAVKNKNTIDQAESLVKQALIFALENDYLSAENTIIRTAIPLLNRAKFYRGKIWAWEMLADIYQMQNKHTEAQWFLIQARDLARLHEIDDELAEIEYMLAYSKYIQKNYTIAQVEFINAYDLADKEDNGLLKLAIVEKLGNIYLMQNDIDQADSMLKEYWMLRTQLL
jgi:tetratricopeptide (TPR) repeat protein